jgi:hypothetical protein
MNIEAKRHPKMLYGPKSDHQDEGIFVSLFHKEDGTVKLFCNGLHEKETYSVKVLEKGKTVFEKEGNDREMDIPILTTGETEFELMYKDRKVSAKF